MPHRRPGLAVATMLVAASSGLAQCATQWVAGSGLPAIGATVNDTLLWDPDGAGPLPQVLVVGGGWIASSTATPDHIATIDLTTGARTSLGSWTFGDVTAVAVLGNDELVAAGLVNSGTGPVSTIARWSLGAWLPVGVADGQVSSMAVGSNGDLFVGGLFTTVNGTPCASIARWNGASWSSVGAGVTGTQPYIDEMLFLPNGVLAACACSRITSCSPPRTGAARRLHGRSPMRPHSPARRSTTSSCRSSTACPCSWLPQPAPTRCAW